MKEAALWLTVGVVYGGGLAVAALFVRLAASSSHYAAAAGWLAMVVPALVVSVVVLSVVWARLGVLLLTGRASWRGLTAQLDGPYAAPPTWWLWYTMPCNLLNVPPLRQFVNMSPGLSKLVYCGLGAEIGRNVTFGATARLTDPCLAIIGENAVIGDDSLICGHIFEKGRLVLAPVRIGAGATVGGGAMVMPGVEIGAGAIVAASAVVPKNKAIPPGEVWAGVPAKPLGIAASAARTSGSAAPAHENEEGG